MSFIGSIGNILIIGALFVHKRLRVLGNVFIGNLALADLCVSVIINPFSVVGVLRGNFFQTNPKVCDAVGALCIISCTCSIWSIAAIALNRYTAICHRLMYPKIYNRHTITFIVASLWGYCVMLDLPNFLGWGQHAFDPRAYYCAYDYTANYGYTAYLIVLGFWLPMCLVSFCYLRILLFARRSKKRLKDLSANCDGYKNGKNSRIRTTDLRLLKSLASIWVMFMLMWTPYASIVLFDVSGKWPQWFFVLSIALAHTNSSINSVLYAATNKHFREGYMVLVRRVCCCKTKASVRHQYVTDSSLGTINLHDRSSTLRKL